MAKDSENKYTLPLIGGCFLAMLIFTICWGKQEAELLFHDILYTAMVFVFGGGFIVSAVIAEVKRDDPNFDKFRYIALVFAAAFCIWSGMWKSDRAAKESEGIEYKYEQPK